MLVILLILRQKNILYYQLLNFNPLGASKYSSLDDKNAFEGDRPYSEDEMAEFADMVSGRGIKIRAGE